MVQGELIMVKHQRGRSLFTKYKKILFFLSKGISIFPKGSRIKILQFFRGTKGIKGIALRYILLRSICEKCGDNVSVHDSVYLLNPDKLSLGDNVSIHPMCYIDAAGGIEIGNDVSIAHNATILSTTHTFEDIKVPIKDQEVKYEKTKLMDDIWIGCKATILSGTVVGSGVVIAAGSVVNKNINNNTVVAGVPAKKIKDRSGCL